MIFVDDFADKHVAIPNFGLVNQLSLDEILKTEMFAHSDGQLRAVHLILGYTPISKIFQASKCVIKTKDPHLHRISQRPLSALNKPKIRVFSFPKALLSQKALSSLNLS